MNLFNKSLTSRYNTLIRNIKSKSNSFYDSYSDLVEETLKLILDINKIPYEDHHGSVKLLTQDEKIKNFFFDKIGFKLKEPPYCDIIKCVTKCNKHKHHKEKQIENSGVTEIVNFMKAYFDFINIYKNHMKETSLKFDPEYYTSIFGETEREHSKLKEELEILKKELEELKLSSQDNEKYKSIISQKDLELLDLDEQNHNLLNQISMLKDIKYNSLEGKLNNALNSLNDMKDYLVENRILSKKISKLINGVEISDEELQEERKKLENKKKN